MKRPSLFILIFGYLSLSIGQMGAIDIGGGDQIVQVSPDKFNVTVLATNGTHNPVKVCRVKTGQEVKLLIDKVLWKGGGSKKMVFTDWRGYKGHVQNDGLDWMALIAQVGAQRVPASAKEFSFVAKADGELLLYANDGHVKGNSGKGEMTVTLVGGPAPAAVASSKQPEPTLPSRVVPAGMFASLPQMVDSAPSSVLAKLKDSSQKGEGVTEVNEYLSQNVKGKSANLEITVEKWEPWDHPPNNFRIKAAEKGNGKSANVKAIAMWVYFRDDPTAAGQVLYEGSRINVEGVVSRCEVKDNGGMRFNVDLQKSRIPGASPPATATSGGTKGVGVQAAASNRHSEVGTWKRSDGTFIYEVKEDHSATTKKPGSNNVSRKGTWSLDSNKLFTVKWDDGHSTTDLKISNDGNTLVGSGKGSYNWIRVDGNSKP